MANARYAEDSLRRETLLQYSYLASLPTTIHYYPKAANESRKKNEMNHPEKSVLVPYDIISQHQVFNNIIIIIIIILLLLL